MKNYYSDIETIAKRTDGTFYVSSGSCGCCAEHDDYDTAEEVIARVDSEIRDLNVLRNSLIEESREKTKSDIIKELAEEMGWPIVDLKLGDEIKTEDLKGFPTIK